MRITKDGSVFRIELGSSPSEFETRISLAVNSHGDMRRPRVEVSEKGLKELFMRMVPHISGAILVNDDYAPSYRLEVVRDLVRILDEIVRDEEFMRGLSSSLAEDIRQLAVALAAKV